MVIGNKNFTNFENIRLKGNKLPGSGQVPAELRLGDGSAAGTEGTLSIGSSLDAARAWTFPNRSGRFGTTGSFTVDIQGVAATTFNYSTVVTVSGITAQDAIVVTLGNVNTQSARVFLGAAPGAGNITLYFLNIGAASNGQYSVPATFTAVRD